MGKYPTEWVYFIGIRGGEYFVAKQSKYSPLYTGKKYATKEEAQLEADIMNQDTRRVKRDS